MEDAALEAYVYYHSRCFYDIQENRYQFLPLHDHEDKTWVVLTPSAADPTIDTTVRHLCATHVENEALKEELRMAQKTARRLQKKIDEMGVQLGQPTMYKKKAREFTTVDRAP
jgi:hypothetical protein